VVVKLLLVFLALLLASFVWVRLAPSDVSKWHYVIENPQNNRFQAGLVEVLPNKADSFSELYKIAVNADRTVLLAGSIDEGMATFITRSKLWGFPDYTTIWINGDALAIHARARFGKSDIGVNAARVSKWLATLSDS